MTLRIRAEQAVHRLLPAGSFLRQSVVLAGGTAAGQAIIVLSTPILSRLYTPAELGQYGLFLAFVNTAAVAVALRYELALPAADDSEEAGALALLVLLLSIPLSLACGGLLAALIHLRLLSYETLPVESAWLAVIILLATGAGTGLRYWLVREQQFREISAVVVAQAAGKGIVPIVAAPFGLGWLGLVLGEFAGRALGLGRMLRRAWPTLRRAARPSERPIMWRAARRFWKFPAISVPSSVVDVATLSLPVVLISNYFGASAAGIFVLVQRVLWTPASLVATSVADVFHARTAENLRADPSGLRAIYLRTARRLALAGAAVLTPIAVLGPPLFQFVFGRRWADGAPLIMIMAPWALASVIVSPLTRVLFLTLRTEWKLIYDAVAFASTVGVLFAAHRAGWTFLQAMIGLTLASVLSYGMFFQLMLVSLNRPSRGVVAGQGSDISRVETDRAMATDESR